MPRRWMKISCGVRGFRSIYLKPLSRGTAVVVLLSNFGRSVTSFCFHRERLILFRARVYLCVQHEYNRDEETGSNCELSKVNGRPCDWKERRDYKGVAKLYRSNDSSRPVY